MKLRTKATTGAGIALIGVGVALGVSLAGHSASPTQPVVIEKVAAVASSTPAPIVKPSTSARRAVVAPRVATVSPVTTSSDVPQTPASTVPTTQPAAPAEQTSDPVQVFPVTPDSAGRVGNAPPPPPATHEPVAPISDPAPASPSPSSTN